MLFMQAALKELGYIKKKIKYKFLMFNLIMKKRRKKRGKLVEERNQKITEFLIQKPSINKRE